MNRWVVISLVALGVICFWCANGFLLQYLPGIDVAANRLKPGEFGDQFGAINALFSGLAFAGVFAAIWFQREELALQRQANKDAQRELESQRMVGARREFQTVFFDMLRTLQDTVELVAIQRTIKYEHFNAPAFPQPERWRHGRAALRDLSNNLKSTIEDGLALTEHNRDDDESLLNAIDENYAVFYMHHGDVVGHYFRMMYQIARFIDNAPAAAGIDKQTYVRILRAQLSQPEMVLLLYNCLSRYGYEKFHPLVEKYDLLQNLEVDAVPARHWDLYPMTRDRRTRVPSRLQVHAAPAP